MPLSVIIPTYNRRTIVIEAIHSVLEQDASTAEIIVVDDGSTDKTLDVLEEFGDNITVLAGANRGASAARNAGVSASESSFVAFLDSDDVIEGSYYAQAVDCAHSTGASMVFGPWKSGARPNAVRPRSISSCVDLANAIRVSEGPCNGSILWRRDFLLHSGAYLEGYSYAEDFELYFRALSYRPPTGAFSGASYVARDCAGAARLSHVSERALLDAISAFDLIHTHLIKSGAPADYADDFLRDLLYEILRSSARLSKPEAYKIAKDAYRNAGGRGHRGSVGHVIVSSVLGIRLKEHAASLLRAWRPTRAGPRS